MLVRACRAPFVLASAWLLGCGTPCDARGLRAAAEIADDRSADARRAFFKHLGEACPTMPKALGESLVAGYSDAPADWRATIYANRFKDQGYTDARAHVCSAEVWTEAIGAGDRDAAVFEACGLGLYDLLIGDESFAVDDFDAYVLYDWLRENRNDQAVSRKVARGLTAASATDAELVPQRLSLTLPTTTSAAYLRDGITAQLTPGSVGLDGTAAAEFAAGEGFVHHVHPRLYDRFMELAEAGRAEADAEMMTWDGRVRLLTDAYAPFRDVADGLFTANKAGFTQYQLVAFAGHTSVAVNVSPPRSWLKGKGSTRMGRTGQLEVDVRLQDIQASFGKRTRRSSADAQSFRPSADCSEAPADCLDHAALEKWFTKTKRAHPGVTVVTFNVDPDVRLQTVVTLIDLARGTGCRLDDRGEEQPAECLFWLPIIDLLPGLYWGIDLDKTVVLGDAVFRSTNPHIKRRRVREQDVRKTYDASREALVKCLYEDTTFQRSFLDTPRYTVMFSAAATDPKRLALRVWDGGDDDPFADPELQVCFGMAFGTSLLAVDKSDRVELELNLPMTVSITPKPR